MSKLKYFIDSKAKKTYTIKEQPNQELKDAHYKFIKIRDAPKSK